MLCIASKQHHKFYLAVQMFGGMVPLCGATVWCKCLVQMFGGIHLSFRPTKVLDMEVVEFSFFFSILGARGAS